MIEDDILCRAQRAIARKLRHEAAGARAVMEFDPHDKVDVVAWLRRKISESKTDRYKRSPRLTVRNFTFDALQEARKARRTLHRAKGKLVPVRRVEDFHSILDKRIGETVQHELVEELAICALRAGSEIVSGATKAPGRKASAVLSCLGRLTATIGEELGHAAASEFIEVVSRHSDFLGLPLCAERQQEFCSSALRILPLGGLRRDLAAAKLPWPTACVWNVFINFIGKSQQRLAA